jgi:hypothetical protein
MIGDLRRWHPSCVATNFRASQDAAWPAEHGRISPGMPGLLRPCRRALLLPRPSDRHAGLPRGCAPARPARPSGRLVPGLRWPMRRQLSGKRYPGRFCSWLAYSGEHNYSHARIRGEDPKQGWHLLSRRNCPMPAKIVHGASSAGAGAVVCPRPIENYRCHTPHRRPTLTG